jgi:hypothetical protein
LSKTLNGQDCRITGLSDHHVNSVNHVEQSIGYMTEAELIRAVLIEGAIGGAMLSLLAFVLSTFTKDIVGRTLLATVLFAAAGAYFGFAFAEGVSRVWVLIELLQCIAFGTLGLIGWRGPAKWLALGWLLHPIWDFGLHYLGPGRIFAPLPYAIACISFDWVVAAYILIAYRGASHLTPNRGR